MTDTPYGSTPLQLKTYNRQRIQAGAHTPSRATAVRARALRGGGGCQARQGASASASAAASMPFTLDRVATRCSRSSRTCRRGRDAKPTLPLCAGQASHNQHHAHTQARREVEALLKYRPPPARALSSELHRQERRAALQPLVWALLGSGALVSPGLNMHE